MIALTVMLLVGLILVLRAIVVQEEAMSILLLAWGSAISGAAAIIGSVAWS